MHYLDDLEQKISEEESVRIILQKLDAKSFDSLCCLSHHPYTHRIFAFLLFDHSSLQQFEKLGWIRKAQRGRKLTKAGQLFLDEFSGRIQRSPMVTAYWRRRQKQERLKRKLARRKAQENGTNEQETAGGPMDDGQGGDDMEMNDDMMITPQNEENVETVNEYD